MNASGPTASPAPVTKSEGFNYWSLLSRVIVIGLLAGSVVLLWWAYYRIYAPRHRQAREVNNTLAQLSAQVDQLDGKWSREDIDHVNARFAEVPPRLFASQLDLESWLAAFERQTASLGLDLKTDFAATNQPAGPGIVVIPATIGISFQPLAGDAASQSPYQRLLEFVRLITSQNKTVVLTDLTVTSGTNSVDHAVLGFDFWANSGTNTSASAKEAK